MSSKNTNFFKKILDFILCHPKKYSATFIILFLIFTALAFYYASSYCNTIDVNTRIYLLIFVTSVYLILVFYISVRVVNAWREELKNKMKNDGCHYCGCKDAGPFLCGHCNSITWYNLTGNGWLLHFSVIFLERRWESIVAFATLLYFLTITALLEEKKEVQAVRTEKINQNQSEQKENMEALNKILDGLSVVRAKIVDLETLAPNTTPIDFNEWRDLHIEFTKTYWNIVPSFERLLKNTLDNDTEFKTVFDAAKNQGMKFDEFKSNYDKNKAFGPAWMINCDTFELSCVSDFVKYMNAVAICKKDNTYKAAKNRKDIANQLYHRLRLSSIMIRVLIDGEWLLHGDGKYQSKAADNAFYFRNIFDRYKGDKQPLKEDAEAIFDRKLSTKVRDLEAFKIDPSFIPK